MLCLLPRRDGFNADIQEAWCPSYRLNQTAIPTRPSLFIEVSEVSHCEKRRRAKQHFHATPMHWRRVHRRRPWSMIRRQCCCCRSQGIVLSPTPSPGSCSNNGFLNCASGAGHARRTPHRIATHQSCTKVAWHRSAFPVDILAPMAFPELLKACVLPPRMHSEDSKAYRIRAGPRHDAGPC